MDFLAPHLFVVALCIVAVGALAQGMLGMGFGQIASAGLIWVEPQMVPTSIILMAFLVGFSGALRDRKSILIRPLSFSIFGRFIGTLMALPLLVIASQNQDNFLLLFGVLILIAVTLSIVKITPTFNALSQSVAGSISGFMGTISAVGAPPMAIVFQHQQRLPARATLNSFFAISAMLSLIALVMAGQFSVLHLGYAISLSPGLIAGIIVSKKLTLFDDGIYRYGILLFTGLSGIGLIVRYFL